MKNLCYSFNVVNKLVETIKTEIMKKILMTLVGSLAITLLISAGVKKNMDFLDRDSIIENTHSSFLNNETMEGMALIDLIGDPNKIIAIKIEDVKVVDMEEEVELGFDTLDYLPMGFNPVANLKIEEQLQYEREYVFNRVFDEIDEREVLKIEDINLYELEDTM